LAPTPGSYRLEFLEQRFTLQMDGQTTARLTFTMGDAGLTQVHGAIAGSLSDGKVRLAGYTLRLETSGEKRTFQTDRNGLYRFENLPAGTYQLALPGDSLVQTLTLDGQSFQGLDLTFPLLTESGGWRMVVSYGGNAPVIVGDIRQANQPLRLTGPSGAELTATSGTKPEYGPGGFEIQTREQGYHTLQFLNRRFTLPLQGKVAQLRFEVVDAPPVRITSQPLARAQAEALLTRFAADPNLKSIFRIEDL
jgi:hypothetical protein